MPKKNVGKTRDVEKQTKIKCLTITIKKKIRPARNCQKQNLNVTKKIQSAEKN